MLLLEDIGLDDDYDGRLTEDEVAALQGFDMDWPEGLTATSTSRPAAIPWPSARRSLSARPCARRDADLDPCPPLAAPVDPDDAAVAVKVYDPIFYTSYSILPEQVTSDRADCRTPVFTPDMDAAYAQLEAALAELGAEIDDPFVEQKFPPVGDRFAEEVRLVCGGTNAGAGQDG